MSKAMLLEKLTDKDYRDAFVSEEIDVGLPMQIRDMREIRGWNQHYVAEKTGTKQPRFSLMEKIGYGNYSLNTLKKLASLFDVGLIVSFVPFSEMIDFVESISKKRLQIPSFTDEYSRLEKRYRVKDADVSQQSFDFSVNTQIVSFFEQVEKKNPFTKIIHTSNTGFKPEDVPLELLKVFSETGEMTYGELRRS